MKKRLSFVDRIFHQSNIVGKCIFFEYLGRDSAASNSLKKYKTPRYPQPWKNFLLTTLMAANSKIKMQLRELVNLKTTYFISASHVQYSEKIKMIEIILYHDIAYSQIFFSFLTLAFYTNIQYNGMDNERNGGLPSYVYTLLAVFFLQRPFCGLLPVLHEVCFIVKLKIINLKKL